MKIRWSSWLFISYVVGQNFLKSSNAFSVTGPNHVNKIGLGYLFLGFSSCFLGHCKILIDSAHLIRDSNFEGSWSLLFVRNTFRYCHLVAIIMTKNVRFSARFWVKCSQLFQDWLHEGSQLMGTTTFVEIQPVSTTSTPSGKCCPLRWLPFNGTPVTSFGAPVQVLSLILL